MARVRLISRGMGQMLGSGEVRALLTAKADAVAARAREGAPVDTGAYRASIEVVQDSTDRAVVRVVAGVPYALVVEADTGNLARALDAAK